MYPVPQANGLDPNAALRFISQRAQVLTRSTGAAIALGHKESMICLASVGANAPTLGSRLDVSTGFSGECVRTAKAQRCDNSDTDSRVDAESCRRLGVRSILAAPITFAGEVVGVLEAFSSECFAFHDGDLVVLENLAETILEIRSSFNPVPAPNLLFKVEPAYRVFFSNLIDTLHPPQLPPLKVTSLPARFWPDVFVPSQLPWQRFVQSMVLHVIMVVALGGLLEFGFSQRQLRHSQLRFNKSAVIYYSPSDYLSSFKRDTGPSRSHRTQQSALVKQAVISVPRESGRRTPTSVTPPTIKLNEELRLARIMAWNSVIPAVPLMATMRSQRNMPAVSASAIAPPPDISEVSPSRHLTPATPVVIEPAPSMDQSIRQIASISIGHLQVVGPAIEMPLHQQVSFPAKRTLIASTSVVPPPPAVGDLGNTGHRTSALPDEMRIVPPAPLLQSTGSHLRSSLQGGRVSAVPPPPSVRSLGNPGGQQPSSLSAGADQVVPPAPSFQSAGSYARGTSGSIATSVAPPPPSINSLGHPGGQRVSSLLAAGRQIAPLPVLAAIHPPGDRSRSGKATTMANGLPGGPLPGEIIPSREGTVTDTNELPDTKELSVSFMVPALVLPMSSYFSNYEVFIAEQRVTRHQSRLIKLVYEFLSYQPRLSDYGANDPGIENLRATRDRSCDQALMQVASSASTVPWSQSARLQLSAKSLEERQSTLECYRTTADDYRRARARQHRQKVATSNPGSAVLPD
ncbi:MAG TPA: GAF domain-containing protein [Terriglobales bacterium]|nr:GAF domain-containing protein [Terriglobales bacterium]